jgi:hypothetical protein
MAQCTAALRGPLGPRHGSLPHPIRAQEHQSLWVVTYYSTPQVAYSPLFAQQQLEAHTTAGNNTGTRPGTGSVGGRTPAGLNYHKASNLPGTWAQATELSSCSITTTTGNFTQTGVGPDGPQALK